MRPDAGRFERWIGGGAQLTGQPVISVAADWTDDGCRSACGSFAGISPTARCLRAAVAFEQSSPWAHRIPRVSFS
jgi:hypothetical protein